MEFRLSSMKLLKGMTSIRINLQQYSYITNVCTRWPGDNRIAKFFKEAIRIASSEKLYGIQTKCTRAIDCRFVDNCSGGRTVAINPISARTQNYCVLIVLLAVHGDGTTQNGFEISSAPSITS